MYNINMKRVNTKTNQPFKYGDVREDGFVFVDFRTTKPLSSSTSKAFIWPMVLWSSQVGSGSPGKLPGFGTVAT